MAKTKKKPDASRPKADPAPHPPDAAPAASNADAAIAHSLRAMPVAVGDLLPDPANARKHDEANITAIMASLRAYGQRTPIVANRRNAIVLKGNGTLAAAKALGWSHLAVVWVDDDPTTAAGYSIADNRSAELAEWDKEALDGLLRSVQSDDEDLAGVFDQLAQDLGIVPGEESAAAEPADAAETFGIVIDCKDEEEQLALIERFSAEGLEVRALENKS